MLRRGILTLILSGVKKSFQTKTLCYKRVVDGKECSLKIDTDFDVLLLSSRMVGSLRLRLPTGAYNLRYPTGEKVVVLFKVVANVAVGRFSLEFSFLVAKISDKCILGVDFFREIDLERIFKPEFEGKDFATKSGENCSRIISGEKVPGSLEGILQQSAEELSGEQKNVLASFLLEFQNVFTEDIPTGNCKVLEHVIDISDAEPIKQASIPIHLR